MSSEAAKSEVEFEFKSNISKLPKPKDTTIDLANDKLKVSDDNVRLDGKNNELGIDTTGLDELEMRVRADGRILKHMIINEDTANQILEILGGGRRFRVGRRILNDPNAPQDLVKELGKVPAYVYKDLTEEQKLFLMNDQDQKKFKQTEIVRLILRYLEEGKTWSETASLTYRQWAEVTRADKILNEVDAITDVKAKRKRIEKWLRGTIDEKFNAAFKIGPMCTKALFVEAAETDKLIWTKKNAPEGTPSDKIVDGPYVYLSQARLKELEAAKAEDQKTGEWNGISGGPKFLELWVKFHNEDYNGKTDGPKPKSLTREKLQELKKTANSKFGTKLLDLAAGEKDVAWKDSDTEIALFEAKKLMYLQNASNFVNEDTKRAFYMLMVETDFEKFKEWFLTFLKPQS